MFQSTRPRRARLTRARPSPESAPFQSTRPRRARQGGVGGDCGGGEVSIHAPAKGATWLAVLRAKSSCRFNPRAREGRDADFFFACMTGLRFNPRAREGRDASVASTLSTHAGFNPRAREGRDLRYPLQPREVMFQSTRPRRARLEHAAGDVAHLRFNPRAREGRDGGPSSCKGRGSVSIHAPAKGATSNSDESSNVRSVSIHAPAKGATWPTRRWTARTACFNPRAREGRDLGIERRNRHGISFNPRAREGRDRRLCVANQLRGRVSIHAPAKGATRHGHGPHRGDAVSIHAPAKGATSPRMRKSRYETFQSTRPRRARHGPLPHAPHRPAKGATRVLFYCRSVSDVSIHAPAKGATFAEAIPDEWINSFNPRAREGRDVLAPDTIKFLYAFQSTRPRRARPWLVCEGGAARRCFNPRAREGRDAGLAARSRP